MFLISGLGNPGEQYEKTPHNSGFMFVDKFKVILKDVMELTVMEWSEDKMFQSQFSKIEKDGELKIVFQKPQTFMNNSGVAVLGAIRKFKVQDYLHQLILVHDDLDLKLGKYKIQEGKSPKAHNGVLDVEEKLGGKDFLRVRIGVDNREDKNIPGEKYVLMPFSDDEYSLLNGTIMEAIGELRTIIKI